MSVGDVQNTVAVSMLKNVFDTSKELSQKMFDSLDQTSQAINNASQQSEPGKGKYIDIRI